MAAALAVHAHSDKHCLWFSSMQLGNSFVFQSNNCSTLLQTIYVWKRMLELFRTRDVSDTELFYVLIDMYSSTLLVLINLLFLYPPLPIEHRCSIYLKKSYIAKRLVDIKSFFNVDNRLRSIKHRYIIELMRIMTRWLISWLTTSNIMIYSSDAIHEYGLRLGPPRRLSSSCDIHE